MLLAAAGLGVWFWLLREPPGSSSSLVLTAAGDQPLASGNSNDVQEENLLAVSADAAARADLAARLQDRLNRPGIRANEAILTFKDAAAYRRFLERARAAGLEVVAKIDSLNAVRVRIGDYTGLVGDIAGNVGDYASVGANPILSATPPPAEERAARSAVPVGENLLSVLGIAPGTDTSSWGRGILVAVLDGGASAAPTLGTRLKYLDIGYGTTGLGADGAHGTAVASIVGGASAEAKGVAPAANILSVRVTGADGVSDAFSVAQGILAALDAGAKVINISLGGYSTSPVLGAAIEEAIAAGVAVVASSGNDQANQIAWPAAYAGVVSVGATDAVGMQAIFSNSGDGLQLTAPGYALQAASPAGAPTSFSGTSASAPVVAGAIATLMSQWPDLTALEAADLLATHANDGGVAGADPDYGHGWVNLRWAMNHDNPSFTDPAISSQSYDAATGTVSIVVQNRGSNALSGASLAVGLDGTITRNTVADLAPGASTTITVPVSDTRRDAGGNLVVSSQLSTTAHDQNVTNNRRAGIVTLR
jgi:hypothetical protein